MAIGKSSILLHNMASFSFPQNPVDNQLYIAPNNVRYQYRDASRSWSTHISTTSGLEGANPGANPPSDPNEGTLWLDTDTKILYVFFSGDWTAVTGTAGAASPSDPAGLALEGTAIYDGTVATDVGIHLEI